MEQTQRRDIDTALERITLGIDEENITQSPYSYLVTNFVGNNWVMDEIGGFVKYSLAEEDSISFPVDAITSLVYKDITNVTVSFDYEVSTKCVLRNVGFSFAEQTQYKVVETVLNGQGHIDVECSLFGFESDLLNTAISEQGFSIVLNFDGVKSNALVILRNVTFDLSFNNDLMSESDAVVNRVNFQTDFYNDDESVILKVGEVEYPIKLQDMFGSAYYDYNLYTSNYNPKINTTITVTCQVKDIFGNPVANKKLILYYKGIAQDPVTTNANGIAEWQINVGETDGTFKISVNNRYLFINVIYDTGWVYGNGENSWMNSHWLDYSSANAIRVRRVGKVVHFEGTAKPNNSLTWTEGVIQIGTLPSQFRPNHTQRFVQQGSGLNKWVLSFEPNGIIGFARYGTTSNITMPADSWMNMYATWMVE